MASILEAIASLGQRIDRQQAQLVLPQDDARYDPIIPPPSPPNQSAPQAIPFILYSQTKVSTHAITVSTPISEDPHARMDRFEQRLRQLRTSDGAITWEDFDGAPVASLPTKFRMPTIERYTGIGCPRIHLRLYSMIMRAHGLDEAQMVMFFPMSLSGAAQHWFASLDISHRRTQDDLAQEFLRQFAFNTIINVSRKQLKSLRQRLEESVTSFISRWREKISQVIDRPSKRDQISMIIRSLQPRFARHLIGFLHIDFGSLVQALYGIEEATTRGLWSEFSPTESKGKRPLRGQRPRDVGAISSVGLRPLRRYQVGQTYGFHHPPPPCVHYRPRAPPQLHDQAYLSRTLALPYYATQVTQRPLASYPTLVQPCYAAHFVKRPLAPYPRPRAPQTFTPFALKTQRLFSQLGMPLSQALRKLIEVGLLTTLALRPLP